MTEQEWLACTNPTLMLGFLRGKVSDRKLRLFACACCRRIWELLSASEKQTIECADRYADGLATDDEFLEAQSGVGLWFDFADDDDLIPDTIWAVLNAISSHPFAGFYRADAAARASGCHDEFAVQCQLVCDIFGSLPFRPIPLDFTWLAWNDGTVKKIAHAIYDDRAFERLPILADALEEAGCTNEGVLNHCRSDGPHVRGCWVVDLLLGK